MKLKMTVITILACTLLLCACSTTDEAPQNVGKPIAGITVTEDPTSPIPDPTDPTDPTVPIIAETPTTPYSNEFINENNFHFVKDNVDIRPRHVYWDGDILVAECFITNGLDKPVYDLDLSQLIFSNDDGVIADGGFGIIGDCVVPPNSYVVWTFTFGGDAIKMANGNLYSLNTKFSVGYNY